MVSKFGEGLLYRFLFMYSYFSRLFTFFAGTACNLGESVNTSVLNAAQYQLFVLYFDQIQHI